MSDIYGHLGKYTDIDKDILQMENIKKNLLMKGRKPNASGGIAGQLHLNQGGVAWPAGRERLLEEEKIDDDWYANKYEKFLDDYLTSQEGSPDAFNQQDVNIISSFFNNYVEHGGDPTKFEERIQNLLRPPEKPSNGLSHILGV